MDGDVDRAREQLVLDLPGKQALAADLRQLAIGTRSPVVRVSTMFMLPADAGCASASVARTSAACANASLVPRVPMRSFQSHQP